MPVVVVLYHPETGRCHWQLVSQKTLVATSAGGWKLRVPAVNVLGATARATLQKAAEGAADVPRTRSPGSKRLPARRRAIVLGGLAAAASAAVPTTLILSRDRPSRTAGPVIITECRIFTEDGVVNTVAFNPHDGTLASGTDKGTVRLRNGTTGRQVGIKRVDPSQRQPLGLGQSVGRGQRTSLQLLLCRHPGLFGGVQP